MDEPLSRKRKSGPRDVVGVRGEFVATSLEL
jgi:hypothetical protein